MLKRVIVLMIICSGSNGNKISKLTGGVRVSSNGGDRNDCSQAAILHDGFRMCSGSVISPDHVLTTASCVLYEKTDHIASAPGNLQVLVGTNDIFNLFGQGQLHNVKFIMPHENYMPELFWRNDIAILRLETSIRLTARCTEIYPRERRVSGQSMVTITNWGSVIHRTSNDNRFLKCVHAKVISQTTFVSYFQDHLIDHRIQACANTIHPTDEFTSGDSGTAIVRDNEIVGVASILDPEKTRLIIFTKIIPFLEFIEKTIENY